MREQDDSAAPQVIPVKVYRGDGRITVASPMPGLEPEDIEVDVTHDNRIVLHGGLRGTLKGANRVVEDEWTPGPYHREYRLPDHVDGEMANVTYGNGVVVVALPVSDGTRPARLIPHRSGMARGEVTGNTGHPVRPFGERLNEAEKPADAQAMTERIERGLQR
ncbi:MAG TPA: Hsp20/alpha crystallin family protein [Dehalococcoidia bacterium]|nr:Hsp20/alpha crystallin family protein [Dehalococcoidia bacterium]